MKFKIFNTQGNKLVECKHPEVSLALVYNEYTKGLAVTIVNEKGEAVHHLIEFTEHGKLTRCMGSAGRGFVTDCNGRIELEE
jgi:hypothetical protein